MKIKFSFLTIIMCLALLFAGCAAPSTDTTEESDGTILSEMRNNPTKYIELGQYKGLEVEVPSTEITEADIQAKIDSLLTSKATQVEVTDRVTQLGDTVTIDFVGYVDGEKVDSASATDYELTLGQGGYIAGFEEGIVGVALNSPYSLELTFPDEYYEDLAGKAVKYDITIKKIVENVLPELTDEFIAANTSVSTIDEYKHHLEHVIAEEKEDEKFNTKLNNVWDLIVSNSKVIELPADRVQGYIDEAVAYYTNYASSYGMTLEAFLSTYFGTTEEQFRQDVALEAEASAKSELVVYAIAKAENIELTEEEYTTRMQDYLSNFGYENIADMETDYGKDTLEVSILRDIVYEYVLEQTAEIVK